MVGRYKVLLRSVTDEPDGELRTMSILPPEERNWLVEEVNATEGVYPEEIVPRLFEGQAAQHPERIALQHEDVRLTYGELNARANRLAHRLRALGVGPGRVVGVCLPRSGNLLTTLLAVQKAGAAYVPLDPRSPPTAWPTCWPIAAPTCW